ncbi:PREDICTED: uncharacterized protein LOC105556064, partial [Vollenhovia emeryi]|uniref:uncharacterized protein LOC105556064 n=1 Tax=Vollenhovia emeryi TaxID=411798 RepID=UPI0005F3B0E7
MALLPGEQKAARRQGDKRLPTISKIEVVKGEMKAKGKEAFKMAFKQKAQKAQLPKEEVPAAGRKQELPGTSWVEVVRKGKGKKQAPTPTPKDASKEKAAAQKPQSKGGEGKKEPKGERKAPKQRRAPRSAAVALTFPEGEAGEGMRYIRSQVKLEELGIDSIKPRKALTGAMLLEIPGGEEAKAKADALASKITSVVEGRGIKVTRPAKMAEMRLKDLDESVSQEEVQAAIAKAGGCPPEEVKVGRIRTTPSGLGSTWIQCRLEVARKLAAAKKIKIGWVAARIELLEARPLTCFRCLERGHVRQQCKSTVDRSTLCYRFGQEGHMAQTCTAMPNCVVCKAKGLPANHKAGGNACRSPSKREKKRAAKLAKGNSRGPTTSEVPMEVQEADEPVKTDAASSAQVAMQAQDIFLHSLAERGCGLGIVAEPYRVPKSPCWAESTDGTAAITWRRTGERSLPGTTLKAGEGWVAVEWGPLVVIGIYLRPGLSRVEIEGRLQELEDLVREFLPGPVLVAGDFNAKSAMWSSRRPDAKGREVEAWADRLGLHLENVGAVSTCVRPQGESIVDLTWSSPAAARMVASWKVVEDLELLSDHLPIEVVLSRPGGRGETPSPYTRWAVKKLNPDGLMESLATATWAQPEPLPTIEEEAQWLRRTMRAACDNAMPRARFTPRKAAYWWSESIAELRRLSVAARRAVQRARRRAHTTREAIEELLEAYRERRKILKAAVRKAKEDAWDELIASIDADPWGRPYKLVMNKLGSGALPAVEVIKPHFLEEVVAALFPTGRQRGTPEEETEREEEHHPWTEDLKVHHTVIARAAKKLKAGKAPGPDGVPGVVWRMSLGELSG